MYENNITYALVVSGTLNALCLALVIVKQIIVHVKTQCGRHSKSVSTSANEQRRQWIIAKGYVETGCRGLLIVFAIYLLCNTDVIQYPFEHRQSTSTMNFIVISSALGGQCGRLFYTLTSMKKFLTNMIESLTWIITYSIILQFQELQLVGLIGIIMESDRLITSVSVWAPCFSPRSGYTSGKGKTSECCALHTGLRIANTLLLIPCRFVAPIVLLTLGIINENPNTTNVHSCSIVAFFYFFCFCGIISMYRLVCEFSWLSKNIFRFHFTHGFKSKSIAKLPNDQKNGAPKNNVVSVQSTEQIGGHIYVLKNIDTTTNVCKTIPSFPNTNVDTSSVPKLFLKKLYNSDSQTHVNNNIQERTLSENVIDIQQGHLVRNVPKADRNKAPNFAITLDTISEYSHPCVERNEDDSISEASAHVSAPVEECWVNVEL